MRDWGFWTTAIAALVSAVAGWRFGARDRATGCASSLVVGLLWLMAWSAFIENCGAGGGCENYADWSGTKAALVAVAPSLILGSITAAATRALLPRRSERRQDA